MQYIDVEVTPAISTAIHTAGDVVSPIQELTGIGGEGGELRTITIFDDADQKAALDIYLFKELPTGTYTANAVFALDAADKPRLIGVLQVVAGDYVVIAPEAMAVLPNVGFGYGASPGFSSLHAVVTTPGTPTYAAATDLRFRYHAEQGPD